MNVIIDTTATKKKRKDERENKQVKGFLLIFDVAMPKTIEIINKE